MLGLISIQGKLELPTSQKVVFPAAPFFQSYPATTSSDVLHEIEQRDRD